MHIKRNLGNFKTRASRLILETWEQTLQNSSSGFRLMTRRKKQYGESVQCTTYMQNACTIYLPIYPHTKPKLYYTKVAWEVVVEGRGSETWRHLIRFNNVKTLKSFLKIQPGTQYFISWRMKNFLFYSLQSLQNRVAQLHIYHAVWRLKVYIRLQVRPDWGLITFFDRLDFLLPSSFTLEATKVWLTISSNHWSCRHVEAFSKSPHGYLFALVFGCK